MNNVAKRTRRHAVSTTQRASFYDASSAPDPTSVVAGVNDPPAGSIVTANAEGAGELASVNAT
jgi:hypothetical protein